MLLGPGPKGASCGIPNIMRSTPECWPPAPKELFLSDGDVHVWKASLLQPEARILSLRALLSEKEQARADRFYFERDRRRHLVSQGLLRRILARYLETRPEELRFAYGPRGKPRLEQPGPGAALQFNMSHSEELALYAVTRSRKVGIDVEHARPLPEAERIAERFFSPRESELIRSLPEGKRQLAFFSGWTRKEAWVKACGAGIIRHLDKVEVTLAPGEEAKLLSTGGDERELARWSLASLSPAPDYLGALVVEGGGWRLSCWEWTEAAPRSL